MDDRGRRRSSAGCSASHAPTRLDRRDLARLVQLPQPAEAPQLALQIAGRLAEALQPRRAPVDRVDLDERVDQLARRSGGVRSGVSSGVGDARDDHLALDPLHHVERRSRSRLGPRTRRAPSGTRAGVSLQRAQQPRLAQHVVRARRQRRARRAAQHDLGAVALDQVGHVRVALADRARAAISPSPRPCASRNAAQRIEDEQRRAAVALGLRRGLDDVVWCDRRAHRRRTLSKTATFSAPRCLKRPCPESAKLLISTLLPVAFSPASAGCSARRSPRTVS